MSVPTYEMAYATYGCFKYDKNGNQHEYVHKAPPLFAFLGIYKTAENMPLKGQEGTSQRLHLLVCSFNDLREQ
jgi:hypothetical protein